MHQLITTDQLVWAIVTADTILAVPPLVLSAQRVQFASQCVVLFDTLKCKFTCSAERTRGGIASKISAVQFNAVQKG